VAVSACGTPFHPWWRVARRRGSRLGRGMRFETPTLPLPVFRMCSFVWVQRMSAIAAVLAVLIWLLLLSLLCASFPCVCFTLFAFPLV